MSQHGSFHWNELMTADPERAAAFYAGLTGCRIDTMPMPDGTYRVMMQGDRPVGGIMQATGDMPEGWFAYLAVDDVDAACVRLTELGGQVLKPVFEVPGVGRIAIVRDPTGAALGIMTPAPRGP
jgi:hypothetical protein